MWPWHISVVTYRLMEEWRIHQHNGCANMTYRQEQKTMVLLNGFWHLARNLNAWHFWCTVPSVPCKLLKYSGNYVCHTAAVILTRVSVAYDLSTNTGRFIMLSVFTNIYNKRTKGPTLMEVFTATGKLEKLFLTTRDIRCVHDG